jgi:anti-sigma factor RsiW
MPMPNPQQCNQAEILACDYIDGTLESAVRRDFEEHLSSCAGCAAMVADARAVASFLSETEEPEAPRELVTRLLFHLPNAPVVEESRQWWRTWFVPLLQPRLAMGMAMTILSLSMVGRLIGIQPRQLTLADLEPKRVWVAIDSKAHRAWDRAAKYYDNLRVVYDIQTRLEEWTAQEEEERRNQSRAGAIDITPRKDAQGSAERSKGQ